MCRPRKLTAGEELAVGRKVAAARGACGRSIAEARACGAAWKQLERRFGLSHVKLRELMLLAQVHRQDIN